MQWAHPPGERLGTVIAAAARASRGYSALGMRTPWGISVIAAVLWSVAAGMAVVLLTAFLLESGL